MTTRDLLRGSVSSTKTVTPCSPTLPLQHHLGQIVEVLEHTGPPHGPEVQTFANNQIHVYSTRPDQVREYQWQPRPRRNNPLGQSPDFPFITPAHISTHSMTHRRKYHHRSWNKRQGPQSMSSFQERPNHAVKARKVTGLQRCEETQYTRRLQELKRHIRDKHKIRRKCPFEEECNDILKLRGREGTIHFLRNLGR